MRALEFTADVDRDGRVAVTLPEETVSGPVRVLVLVPERGDDLTPADWMRAVAREWNDELADQREDIYSLADGEPVSETG